jgi:hypothetical protein
MPGENGSVQAGSEVGPGWRWELGLAVHHVQALHHAVSKLTFALLHLSPQGEQHSSWLKNPRLHFNAARMLAAMEDRRHHH